VAVGMKRSGCAGTSLMLGFIKGAVAGYLGRLPLAQSTVASRARDAAKVR